MRAWLRLARRRLRRGWRRLRAAAMTSQNPARSSAAASFSLDDIALSSNLMQADGIHPNELGQPRLLDNVWPKLRPLLRK